MLLALTLLYSCLPPVVILSLPPFAACCYTEPTPFATFYYTVPTPCYYACLPPFTTGPLPTHLCILCLPFATGTCYATVWERAQCSGCHDLPGRGLECSHYLQLLKHALFSLHPLFVPMPLDYPPPMSQHVLLQCVMSPLSTQLVSTHPLISSRSLQCR